MERDGWAEQDGVYVHLESEWGVELDEEYGDWVIVFDDPMPNTPSFASPTLAMDWLDAQYAENPRHALVW